MSRSLLALLTWNICYFRSVVHFNWSNIGNFGNFECRFLFAMPEYQSYSLFITLSINSFSVGDQSHRLEEYEWSFVSSTLILIESSLCCGYNVLFVCKKVPSRANIKLPLDLLGVSNNGRKNATQPKDALTSSEQSDPLTGSRETVSQYLVEKSFYMWSRFIELVVWLLFVFLCDIPMERMKWTNQLTRQIMIV